MSILVKGVDMPKNCSFCPLRYSHDEEVFSSCRALDYGNFNVYDTDIDDEEKRRDDCPLIGLSPEGEDWILYTDKIAHELLKDLIMNNQSNEKFFDLCPGQDAYCIIANYVEKYWEHNAYEDVVVRLAISCDGKEWKYSNEIVLLDCNKKDWVVFENDWWEGQKYIKLLGIKGVSELNIAGGIYDNPELSEEHNDAGR